MEPRKQKEIENDVRDIKMREKGGHICYIVQK